LADKQDGFRWQELTANMADTSPSAPEFRLNAATARDYCQSVLATPRAESFWFLTGLAPYRGFSRPFCDRQDRWWWKAKPQFAWPLDFFTPFVQRPTFPPGKCMLGCQYPVAEHDANSRVNFNVIADLADYDLPRVASSKRRAVRKGLKNLEIGLLDPTDDPSTEEARVVWNSHVERTGWNTRFESAAFRERWRPLADHAGTVILSARERENGLLCAWVVGRLVEGCAWVDTIASHSDRLAHRPNDTLIFVLLYNAARTAGIHHANYFLRSALEPLERFKQSMGFRSDGLAARLRVNPLVALGLRILRPAVWRRLHGDQPKGERAPVERNTIEPSKSV